MTFDGKHQCPDCGSDNAVSKATAWDAAAAIPPKAKAELEELRAIKCATLDMLNGLGSTKNPNIVWVKVPRDFLLTLAETVGVNLMDALDRSYDLMRDDRGRAIRSAIDSEAEAKGSGTLSPKE